MKDELSALLDDELDPDAGARAVEAMRRDPALRLRWGNYCLIGDVIRGEPVGSIDFAERVMASVRAEPTVLAPAASPREEQGTTAAKLQSAFAVAASVMGVAAVGWVAMSMLGGDDTLPATASLEAPVQVAEPFAVPAAALAASQWADPHRKYVFVHQAMNGGGPIPGAVQYVRTVSVDLGDARR